MASDGRYKVEVVRKWIDKQNTNSISMPFIWINEVPIKACCFVWRANFDHIPYVVTLKYRGVNIANTTCVLCGIDEETTDHILCDCSFVKTNLE